MSKQNSQIKITDIAKKAQVSTASVSRVINDKPGVSLETRNRILTVMREMQYTPNIFAQNMRRSTSKILGVIISDIGNEFFKEVVRSIEDHAAQFDYKVIIMNSDENPLTEVQAIHMLRAYSVSGMIIASSNDKLDYESLLGSTPAVFFDRRPVTCWKKYDTLLVNNVDGAEMAVQELIRNGAKKVGMISSGVTTAGSERKRGYIKALESYNISYDPTLVKFSNLQMTNAPELVHELMITQKCDGIFAADNTLLKHVLKQAKAASIVHLKISSFDDTDWFDYLQQPINSIKQPTQRLGRDSVNLLIGRINNTSSEPPRIRRFSVQLIRR